MDDSAIICDQIIELYYEETNFNGKKATCKTQKFHTLLPFLLITISFNKILSKTKTIITISWHK